jgi:hypothetical protein
MLRPCTFIKIQGYACADVGCDYYNQFTFNLRLLETLEILQAVAGLLFLQLRDI